MPTQLDMYKARQRELVCRYNGKIIALKDGEVQGVFASKTEALEAMAAKFLPGSFLIIRCTPGDEEYTRRYRSRIALGKDSAKRCVEIQCSVRAKRKPTGGRQQSCPRTERKGREEKGTGLSPRKAESPLNVVQ